jgi:hypothetical protein
MHKIFSVFAMILMVGGVAQAQSYSHSEMGVMADTNGPNTGRDRGPVDGRTYSCRLDGNISGASIGVIIGGQFISGPGLITCRTGSEVRTLPVRMRLIGFGPAIDFTIIKAMHVQSAGFEVVGGPENLVRSYNVGATAGATLINAGIGFNVAIRVSNSGLGFELALQSPEVVGLGARLYGMVFDIQPR